MAHIVESAKSGRARCRTCGEGISKGDLRFGEEVANAFSDTGGTTFHWHHLKCAAKKRPFELREALRTFAEPVPDREEIERLIAENEPKQKPSAYPYAERAKSARSHCGECHTVILKDALRIAVPREQEGPALMMPPTPRYLHVACARTALEGDPEATLAQIEKNSRGLTPADLDELRRALTSGAPPREGADGSPEDGDRDQEPVPF